MVKKVFDRKNLPEESLVEGICNLHPSQNLFTLDKATRRAIIMGSRGEFVGYISAQGELCLFRDRIGGRNLYYSFNENAILVSTDLMWLVKWIKAKPNLNYIKEEYLQFQIPFSRNTFYEGIFKVLPAEIVTFTESNYREEKYWELRFDEKSFNKKDLLDLIIDSVKFRKELLDGEFTSYLSGGIDSSTVTCLAQPNECFSGFYEEESYSEMDYIEAVLKNCPAVKKYTPVKITEDNFCGLLLELPNIIPDPMCGLGIIPQVIVAKEAGMMKGYKYSFTGEGGDEIFTGYNWNTVLIQLAQAAKNLLRDKYMVRYETMAEKILRDGFKGLAESFIRKVENHTDQLDKIWDKSQPIENNIMKINVLYGLPAILTVDERVGIYSGIMPVSPLMDHNIVEYVASINPTTRAHIPKAILREAIQGIVPDKIRLRYDKMGFPVPVEHWKWQLLSPLLMSLKKRDILDFNPSDYTKMDRNAWALCNIELGFRYL
jgi:asparagine synthase (glutamine-hydrolysing)